MDSQPKLSKESYLSALADDLNKERAELLAAGSNWEYRPSTIENFIDSPMFLGGQDNGEYWPVVRQDVIDFYRSKRREACFCEAIGSGKSYKDAIIAAYEAHLLLCRRSPQKTLGLSGDSKLTIVNMGPTAPQAKKIVFSKIKGRIDSSPWFKLLFPYDKTILSELRFPKNIYIVPGNSRETFPLGYDLVCAILDEADFYLDTEDRPSADEIHQAMRMRLDSRIGTKWPWKLVSSSSPVYEDGFIERKVREADEPGSQVFARRRPIWDAKPWQFPGPRVTWSNGGVDYSIPETLLPEARKNPVRFLRDRCAISVTSLMPYFTDHNAIKTAVERGAGRCRFQQNGTFPTDLKPKRGVAYYVHIDLAKSRDACGFALGHGEKAMTVVDFLWRIKPEDGREVNFAAVRQAVLQLRRMGFIIGKVSYDGWQSVDSIQILTSKGIEVELLSLDRNLEGYDTFLEAVNEGRAALPDTTTPEHPGGILVREMKQLELKKGTKVDHPPKGSKDCSDACAGVFYHARGVEEPEPQATLIKKTGGHGSQIRQVRRKGYGGMGTGYGRSRY